MENPKSLIIEPADVYHRLEVCYNKILIMHKKSRKIIPPGIINQSSLKMFHLILQYKKIPTR